MSLLSEWVTCWTILYVWSTSFISLRLFVRYRAKHVRRSDIVTGICLVLSTVMFATALVSGHLSFSARAMSSASPDDSGAAAAPPPGDGGQAGPSDRAALSAFMFMMTALVVVPLTKCCVTLLLLEVEVHRIWRRVVLIVQTLILVTGLVNVSLSFFGCVVIRHDKYWSILSQDELVDAVANEARQPKCVVREQLIPINGALNVLYELVIFVCSISLVFRVRTNPMQKAGLVLTFGLGLFTVAATCMTTYITLTIYKSQSSVREPSQAQLRDEFCRAGVWQAVEAYTGLVIASVLPLRSTVLGFIDRILGSRYNRGSSQGVSSVSHVSRQTVMSLQEKGLEDLDADMTVTVRQQSGPDVSDHDDIERDPEE